MGKDISRIVLVKNPKDNLFNSIKSVIERDSRFIKSPSTGYKSDVYWANNNIILTRFDSIISENYREYFGLKNDNDGYSILFYLTEMQEYTDKNRFSKELNTIFKDIIKKISSENLCIINLSNVSGDKRTFIDNKITIYFKGIQLK